MKVHRGEIIRIKEDMCEQIVAEYQSKGLGQKADIIYELVKNEIGLKVEWVSFGHVVLFYKGVTLVLYEEEFVRQKQSIRRF